MKRLMAIVGMLLAFVFTTDLMAQELRVRSIDNVTSNKLPLLIRSYEYSSAFYKEGLHLKVDSVIGSDPKRRLRFAHGDNERPLIIIDGKFSRAGLENLNPKDIDKISVYRDSTIFARYGSIGKYGVVTVTTKYINKLSAELTIDSVMSTKPLLVIDGKPFERFITVVPNDIYSIDVLDRAKATVFDMNRNVVIVVTKQRALFIYKKAFGLQSNNYKSYLAKNRNNDSGLTYIIDNRVLESNASIDARIDALASIASKVDKVKFIISPGHLLPGNTSLPAVIITTKQN